MYSTWKPHINRQEGRPQVGGDINNVPKTITMRCEGESSPSPSRITLHPNCRVIQPSYQKECHFYCYCNNSDDQQQELHFNLTFRHEIHILKAGYLEAKGLGISLRWKPQWTVPLGWNTKLLYNKFVDSVQLPSYFANLFIAGSGPCQAPFFQVLGVKGHVQFNKPALGHSRVTDCAAMSVHVV